MGLGSHYNINVQFPHRWGCFTSGKAFNVARYSGRVVDAFSEYVACVTGNPAAYRIRESHMYGMVKELSRLNI